MSVYDPLKLLLQNWSEDYLALTFDDIEKVTGHPLPKSAHDYDAWWNNEDPDKTTHVQSKAWTLAGFEADVNRSRRTVTFRRRSEFQRLE